MIISNFIIVWEGMHCTRLIAPDVRMRTYTSLVILDFMEHWIFYIRPSVIWNTVTHNHVLCHCLFKLTGGIVMLDWWQSVQLVKAVINKWRHYSRILWTQFCHFWQTHTLVWGMQPVMPWGNCHLILLLDFKRSSMQE